MVSKLDYANISLHVYDGKVGDSVGQFKMVRSVVDEKTGFKGGIYVNEESKEVIMACAGTEFGEVVAQNMEYDSYDVRSYELTHPDVDNDLKMLFQKEVPEQVGNARALMAEVKEYESQGYTLSVTGHSLGGALAYIVAAENDCGGETFNNPGVGGLHYAMAKDESGELPALVLPVREGVKNAPHF